MCLDGGMDVGSDFESGSDIDTSFDSNMDLDVSAIDTSADDIDSFSTDAVDVADEIAIEDNNSIDVDASSFDVEPFDENLSDSVTDTVFDDVGELTEEQDSVESFEEAADLSPIEDPYMNQEFTDDSYDIATESESVTADLETQDSLPLNDIKEDTSDIVSGEPIKDTDESVLEDDSVNSDVQDTEIVEQTESWIPNDISFENENGELTDIKMDVDFLEEKYSESIAAGDQDMADRYRALHDIVSISKDLELTDGDPDITQLGGLHKNVQGQIDGFESHHIPAQSVQDANPRDLPTIAISQEDHTLTDSYRWKSNREYEPFLPDGIDEHPTYKQEAEEMIDKGYYTDLVRDELFNIRDTTGHKYDGAIKQYLNELSNMIAKDGIPKSKRPKT